MQVDAFWKHWQVTEDPFRAEEARDDPVFSRLIPQDTSHPAFAKVLGEPDRPGAAVVFGEKGSGKTAIRLMLEDRIARHNREHPDRKAWVIRYDDLNPVLDRFAHALRGHREGGDDVKLLARLRLADHQDAILSRAVTRLLDAVVDGDRSHPMPEDLRAVLRGLDRSQRVNLALLAALYDQPRHGNAGARWTKLLRSLRMGRFNAMGACKWLGGLAGAIAVGMLIAGRFIETDLVYTLLTVIFVAASALLLGAFAWRWFKLWSIARKVRREVHVVEREPSQLRSALADLRADDIAEAPMPLPGDHDSRYQWTARLMNVLRPFGYASILVLVDRVDEPAMINGDATKMRSVVWPMLNNKFLQQDGVGVKLLLPVELRHLLHKEDAAFFQRARLDKQHLIDRLVWSGTTLYDLASDRLNVCRAPGLERIALTDLFEQDVTRQDLIDSLDQMLQPRDAFKFLYQAIHEHCATVPHDAPTYRVPRLTLMQVRKQQSQRVQDLSRGLSPA